MVVNYTKKVCNHYDKIFKIINIQDYELHYQLE